ncbi:LOW QUALITY PROTEIN: hypothetical protein PRUPE_1G050500 [Prunus persica]|uniref:Uncharacterized protein n=1 Tax=Prunus persica TaxID=3760 RepID=A0A251QSP0_PRUPE|nr:LOW QUALITY PROTEIN: hypothetical protein PRUPE_1G050500 [Prunus persica]
MANWSELQPDLLQLIMNNLSFVNILRFRAVCSSWNHAAKSCATSSCPPPRTPILHGSCSLVVMKKTTKKTLPVELVASTVLKNRKFTSSRARFKTMIMLLLCVGSSHGWLFINSKANSHLLNPFSRRQIQLPLMWFHIAKAVLSSDPTRDNNFAVVVIHSFFPSKLAFYKHAEEDSRIRRTDLNGVHGGYCDVIFHNEQLFALAGDGSVEVWDFIKSFPIESIDLAQPFAEIKKADIMQDFSIYKYSTQNYLVESLGEILYVGRVIGNFVNHKGIVIGQTDLPEGFAVICPYRTLRFYILKLNITAKKWEKGFSRIGRKLNLLHRWDINFQLDSAENGYGGHDNGVYNIGNKVVKPFDQLDKWKIDPPPFWIVPNP